MGEKFWMWLAWRLPRPLVMWAATRLIAHATQGPYSSTVVPELTFHGAIVLLNMPALTLNDDGIVAQQLFKYLLQRAVLARNGLEPAQQARPVFLWADEAQYFVNSFDTDFQSTCRSAKACTVFLTQSLPTSPPAGWPSSGR